MKYTICIALGWIIGIATGPTLELWMNQSFPQHYARACLDGDECFMTIRPQGAPWLNITCTLTEPVRCEDGDKPK